MFDHRVYILVIAAYLIGIKFHLEGYLSDENGHQNIIFLYNSGCQRVTRMF